MALLNNSELNTSQDVIYDLATLLYDIYREEMDEPNKTPDRVTEGED